MKTVILLPDSVFEKCNRDQTLRKLNQIYDQEFSELDPMLAKIQFSSLPYEDW